MLTVFFHKTMNARENFWNVYCFATNQMRDETAKITAAGISHELIRKNDVAFSSSRNLQFSLWISLKKLFLTTNQKQSLNSACSKTKLPNRPKKECKL